MLCGHKIRCKEGHGARVTTHRDCESDHSHMRAPQPSPKLGAPNDCRRTGLPDWGAIDARVWWRRKQQNHVVRGDRTHIRHSHVQCGQWGGLVGRHTTGQLGMHCRVRQVAGSTDGHVKHGVAGERQGNTDRATQTAGGAKQQSKGSTAPSGSMTSAPQENQP
jgi:hypothetical protein